VLSVAGLQGGLLRQVKRFDRCGWSTMIMLELDGELAAAEVDMGPPGRPPLVQPPVDTDNLPDRSLARIEAGTRCEPHPQVVAEVLLQGGVVGLRGGNLGLEQHPSVDGQPAPVEGLHLVRHRDMGVQIRVAGTAVPELLDEVTEIAARDVAVEFAGVRPGDVAAIVHATINHYEKVGDLVIRNIQDETDPEIHAFVERGRALHRAGTETGFAPYLDPLAPAEKRRTVDALVVALDVFTWKLLRRDMDRSRHDTETTIRTLANAILEAMT
jgi:hypothetical protein